MGVVQQLFHYLTRVDRRWLITWATIYTSFMLIDAFNYNSPIATIIKYSGIFLCFLYSMLKYHKDHLLHLALFFTLLADAVLIFDNTSPLGVLLFCFAQFFHIARLSTVSFDLRALIFYLIIVACILGIGFTMDLPIMYPLAGTYGATLITNVYIAFHWHKNAKTIASTCAVFGFTLFLCCDTCVAISYLATTHVLPFFLVNLANYFAWTFYYPSQVLISNSSKENLPKSQTSML